MTVREIIQAQINHVETDFVPYTLEFESEPQKHLDEYLAKKGRSNELIACVDACGGVFDTWDTFVPVDTDVPNRYLDAYGCIWTRNEVISHVDEPILATVPIYDYKFPTIGDFLTKEKEARLKAECGRKNDAYKILFLGAGPFEYTWRLMGLEKMFETMISDPDAYEYLIAKISELMHSFIDAVADYPVDAFMFGDDWCDQRGCMMGPDRWRKVLKPFIAKLYDHIHKTGKKAITHVCGSFSDILPDLIEIGLDVVESVQPEARGMNPYELKRQYGNKITFWGGLGCQGITTYGTPEEIRLEIRKLRSEMSKKGGFILAPSKPLNFAVPLENIVAIYENFIEENYKIR